MYSKEEQNLYYNHKLFLAIMFDDNYEYYKSVPWIYDIDSLEFFKDVVNCYYENGCLNDKVKSNIYKILVDGRSIKDDDYNERIKLINEIIIILNKKVEDKSLQFYLGQLLLRERLTEKELKKYTYEDILEEIPSLKESIFSDFMVLLSHSEQTSDEQFVDRYLNTFTKDKLYYESITILLKECPSIFQNKLFIDRMNAILELNKEIYKDGNKLNKKLIKQINKNKDC